MIIIFIHLVYWYHLDILIHFNYWSSILILLWLILNILMILIIWFLSWIYSYIRMNWICINNGWKSHYRYQSKQSTDLSTSAHSETFTSNNQQNHQLQYFLFFFFCIIFIYSFHLLTWQLVLSFQSYCFNFFFMYLKWGYDYTINLL